MSPRSGRAWHCVHLPAIAMIHTKCACMRVRRAARALTDAYDDALKPLGAFVNAQPFTPERVLDAIAAAKSPRN